MSGLYKTARYAGRIASALLILALSGCSNNPYPAGETARPVLYRVLGVDPKTMDPSVAYDLDEGAVIDNIYPDYFQYHYLKRDPFVLELGLGAEEPKRESIPVTFTQNGKPVTKTGERWTFKIKQGLRFQDDPCFPGGKGREITAADFVYSFHRMADPAINCPILSYFDDKILGMKAYEDHVSSKKGDYGFPIEGLQVDPKDPYTFTITMNQPYPQLRYLMAMHFTSPLPHEAVEKYKEEFARHPVGCGPYKMEEYIRKQRIVLVKNPNYREEYYPSEGAPGDREKGLLKDAGKRLPLVEKIQFNIISEGTTVWNLFLQGYQDASGVSSQNYNQVVSKAGALSDEMKRKGIQLRKDPNVMISYYCFNMTDPVVGGYTPEHRKLRQAISLAIDSQEEIDLFSQGLGIPAQYLIPPGVFGYDPNYRNPYRQTSVEKAKQLLAEAGYPDGIDAKTHQRLTLYYDNAPIDATGRQLTALLIKNVEAIGIHVESRVTRPNVWQDKVDKGDFQFIGYGWYADYPDPENFVFLLYGPNKRPGPNATAYNNPEYNRLFEQMRVMNDGPEREAIIRKLRDISVEDCPWIFRSHDESMSLFQPWLGNVKPHPIALDGAKYLSIDGEMRDRLQREWNRPNYLPGVLFVLLAVLSSIPAARVVNQRRNRYVRRNQGGAR